MQWGGVVLFFFLFPWCEWYDDTCPHLLLGFILAAQIMEVPMFEIQIIEVLLYLGVDQCTIIAILRY